MNTDTPLPPDVPAGKNPPDGAVIDYLLGNNTSGEVTLEIFDKANHLVRRYSSSDPIPPLDPHLEIPTYWVRPPERLSNKPGLHRFLWDMHYTPLPKRRQDYPMQAVFENTAPESDSPWVMPGTYLVKLTAGGKTFTQPITVIMDPRVKTPLRDLQEQFTLSKRIYDDLAANAGTVDEIRMFRRTAQRSPRIKCRKDTELEKKAAALQGGPGRGDRFGPVPPDSFTTVTNALTSLLQTLQEADVAPTQQTRAAVLERTAALAKLRQDWNALKTSTAGK